MMRDISPPLSGEGVRPSDPPLTPLTRSTTFEHAPPHAIVRYQAVTEVELPVTFASQHHPSCRPTRRR